MKKSILTLFILTFLFNGYSQIKLNSTIKKPDEELKKGNGLDLNEQSRVVSNFKSKCLKCGLEVQLEDMKGHPAVCKGKPSLEISQAINLNESAFITCSYCGKPCKSTKEYVLHYFDKHNSELDESKLLTVGVVNEGFQCGCCNAVLSGEQMVKLGTACCKKNPKLSRTADDWPKNYVCKGCGEVFRIDDKTHNQTKCRKAHPAIFKPLEKDSNIKGNK
jgi:hypothetical protein